MIKRVCVFCGSSPGSRPEYIHAVRKLGQSLASRKIGVVYGGSNIGMMGQLARAVLEHGGQVTGVIPRDLVARKVAYTDLPDLRVVETMHERKALMAELADGFIALPGGFGTIEEFFEVLTWSQLGIHQKPGGLLNVLGYFDQLVRFLDHCEQQQFIEPEHRAMVLIDPEPETLLAKLESYRPPRVDKAAWALRLEANGTEPGETGQKRI